MAVAQTECRQCGTCCANGGPALHSEDKRLIMSGAIPRAHLITIRKGELVHNPVTSRLQSVSKELIKISGIGKRWSCFYFDPEEKGCTIYDKRPQACQALECWDTAAVEEMIDKDLLNRGDLIDREDKMFQAVQDHETGFPCPDLKNIINNPISEDTSELEERANSEVKFRTELVARHDLSLGEELFYFGRPLFHLMISVGARVRESSNRLLITWPQSSQSQSSLK